jgi:putative endonuclease
MFYTYILYSKATDKYYIGATSSLDGRLKKHNNKNKGFTQQAEDWEIVYQKKFSEKADALKHEKEIKNWKSRKMIIKLIENGSVSSERPD